MCTRVCVHMCVCVFTPLLMFLSGILTSSSLILSSLYVRELALYLGPMLQIFCPVFHLSSEFDLQCLFAFLLRHLKKNYGVKFIDLWLILAVFRNPSPIYSWRGTYTCFLLVLAWFSSTPCLFFFFFNIYGKLRTKHKTTPGIPPPHSQVGGVWHSPGTQGKLREGKTNG